MTDFCDLMQTIRADNERKHHMLTSMAASFRSGLPFSFHKDDMADLLDELREDHVDHMVK